MSDQSAEQTIDAAIGRIGSANWLTDRVEGLAWAFGRTSGRVGDMAVGRRDRWLLDLSIGEAVGAARTVLPQIKKKDIILLVAKAANPRSVSRRLARWADQEELDTVEDGIDAALRLRSVVLPHWRQMVGPLPSPPVLLDELALIEERLATSSLLPTGVATASWQTQAGRRMPMAHALIRAALASAEVWRGTTRRGPREALAAVYISGSCLAWHLRIQHLLLPFACALADITRQMPGELPRGVGVNPSGVYTGTWEAWLVAFSDLLIEGSYRHSRQIDAFIRREDALDEWEDFLPRASAAVLKGLRDRIWIRPAGDVGDTIKAGRSTTYNAIKYLRDAGVIVEISGNESYRLFVLCDDISPPQSR